MILQNNVLSHLANLFDSFPFQDEKEWYVTKQLEIGKKKI